MPLNDVVMQHHGRSGGDSEYISPGDLARRWQCARSSVDRIARRAGFTRLCLGTGRNGIIRYLRKEVEAYEASRSVVAN